MASADINYSGKVWNQVLGTPAIEQYHGKQLVKSVRFMFIMMMIIVGMTVALAIYFLLAAAFTDEPNMDRYTVEDLGIVFSALMFAFCGPVLVLKLWNTADTKRSVPGLGNVDFIAKGAIAGTWSGILGFATVQSAYLILAPSLMPI